MSSLLGLLAIDIGIDPDVGEVFGILITWHGVFTAVGILAGVTLAVRIAASSRVNIDPDTAYTLGMIIVFAGIVGARALYVIENYGNSSSIDSFGDIFRITEGGISIWGAIIGGAVGGWAYGLWKRLPARAGADAAAFGMLLGLAIGRIGDLINGEHFAKATDLPWGVVYTNPESPGFANPDAVGIAGAIEAVHPATTYELLGDLAIIGILALVWQRRPPPGITFALSFVLYGVMRFFVSFLRIDSEEPLLGLSTPQLVSLVVVPLAALLALFFWKRPAVASEDTARIEPPPRRLPGTRAERRRRLRVSGRGGGGTTR